MDRRPWRTPHARRPSGLASALVLLGLFGGLGSAGGQPARDPLADLGDPLELERHADRVGDDAILAHLAPDADAPFALRMGAIRAAPWLDAPERALEPLAALAAGDDPDLAPAAAFASQRIAVGLQVDDLVAREVDPSYPVGLASAWRVVADDESARPDIRRLAAATASTLASFLGAGDASAEE